MKREAKIKLRPILLIVACAPFMSTAQEQAASVGGCRLKGGQFVGVQAAPALLDIAAASFDRQTGTPIIYFNPRAVSRLPAPFREFVHAHECAHHYLNHLRVGPVGSSGETEADCWAATELTAQGVLSASDIVAVSQVMTTLLPGDRTHLAGYIRARELQHCVRHSRNTAPDRVASATTD